MKQTERLALCLGLLLVIVGVAGLWKVSHGNDFPQLTIAARLWAAGRPMYAPGLFHQGMLDYWPPALVVYTENCKLYYPPSAAILMLPLAMLPYPVAHLLAFALSVAILFYGVWKMITRFAPHIGLTERVWILAVLCQTITVRWSLESLQSSALATGALALMLVALERKQGWVAAVCATLVCFLKPILGVPFFAIMLIQRRFRMALGVLGVLVLVNGVGFLRVGGGAAVRDYSQNVARLDECECNDPNPYHANSTERTDWTYLFNALQPNPQTSRRLTLLLSLLALGAFVYGVVRMRSRTHEAEAQGILMAPAVCLMLLGTYHHAYDSCLLLIPLILYWGARHSLRHWASFWGFMIFGIWYAVFRPFFRELAQGASALSGHPAMGLERVLGTAFLTIMLLASLVVLHRYASAPTKVERV